jgi:DNA polymerase III subunit alpha
VIRLEDLTGGVGIVAFPSIFDQAAALIAPDRVVLIKGRADLRGRELQLVALDVSEPDVSAVAETSPGAQAWLGPADPADPLEVDVPLDACTGGLIGRLKEVLGAFPGPLPVVVRLVGDGEVTRLRLGEEHQVRMGPALLAELAALLGPNAVRVTVDGPSSTTPGPVGARA